MNYKKIKVWHLIVFISCLTLFLRLERVFELIEFCTGFVSNNISLKLIDAGFSVSVVVLLPLISVLFRKKKILNLSIDLSSSLILALIWFALFAPLVATQNPEKHHDISVAKLLPPFSSVKQLSIGENDKQFYNLWLDNYKEFYADEIQIREDKIILINNDNTKQIVNEWDDGQLKVSSLFFLLGTDEYGRDIFSRIVYGTRVSVFIGLCAVLIAAVIGIFLGFAAGYSFKFIDNILNRFTEMFLVFPIIFLVILMLALFGNSIWIVIVVLGFSGWMSLFKIVRGEVVELKQRDFVITSKLLGYSSLQILKKEILPGLRSPITVNLIFLFGNVIIAEAALSFLGLGVGNSYPTWGAMINQGRYFLSQAWWISFFPCLLLSITLISANSLARKTEEKFHLVSVR